MKRRVIVYIDGFNLYYGLVKGMLWKWLDLVALARSLLRDDMELVGVKYFTSRVRQDDGNAQAVLHQDIYLQALASFPLLQMRTTMPRMCSFSFPAMRIWLGRSGIFGSGLGSPCPCSIPRRAFVVN